MCCWSLIHRLGCGVSVFCRAHGEDPHGRGALMRAGNVCDGGVELGSQVRVFSLWGSCRMGFVRFTVLVFGRVQEFGLFRTFFRI